MTDERARTLHDHLAETAELPVDPAVSPWLGEAAAVAADAADDTLSPAVRRERVAHVRDLLAEVDGTGNEAADAHVAAARDLTDAILAEG